MSSRLLKSCFNAWKSFFRDICCSYTDNNSISLMSENFSTMCKTLVLRKDSTWTPFNLTFFTTESAIMRADGGGGWGKQEPSWPACDVMDKYLNSSLIAKGKQLRHILIFYFWNCASHSHVGQLRILCFIQHYMRKWGNLFIIWCFIWPKSLFLERNQGEW